ncbi:MAG: cell division protein FtsZ, partial [Paracoccaceae bacterium]
APTPEPQPIEDRPDLLAQTSASDFEDGDETPSLFDEPTVRHATDDLPAPVYQPETPRSGSLPEDEGEGADLTAFVAPKPAAPGTPSAETMARMHAAIENAPRPTATGPASPVQRAGQEKSGRFGINNLINRMTGHSHETPALGGAQRIHPRVSADEETSSESDQERVDIPAFLRRQAN